VGDTVSCAIGRATDCSRFHLAVVLAGTLGAGCVPQPTPAGPLEPACEPRSNRDPGRLNIGSAAENYGVIPPCSATLTFAVAANTDLREVTGRLSISNVDGNPVGEHALSVSLAGPDGGMFRGEQALSTADRSCRETVVALNIERCQNADGALISCPDIRVRASMVLERLEARGAEVSVCYTD